MTANRPDFPCVKQYGKILGDFVSGEVPELADGHDLGSCALGRGGSSPPFPTKRFWRILEECRPWNDPTIIDSRTGEPFDWSKPPHK